MQRSRLRLAVKRVRGVATLLGGAWRSGISLCLLGRRMQRSRLRLAVKRVCGVVTASWWHSRLRLAVKRVGGNGFWWGDAFRNFTATALPYFS